MLKPSMPCHTSRLAPQHQQGRRREAQVGNLNLSQNSAQSPFKRMRHAFIGMGFPAQATRSESEGNNTDPSCLLAGNTPRKNDLQLQRNQHQTWKNKHRPRQPQAHTGLVLRTRPGASG